MHRRYGFTQKSAALLKKENYGPQLEKRQREKKPVSVSNFVQDPALA